MSLRILTSFSPNPDRTARQAACVKSWQKLGASIFTVQSSKDKAALRQQFPDLKARWWRTISQATAPLEDIWQWAAQEGGYFLLLNADIELTAAAARLPVLDQQIGDGLFLLIRENYDPPFFPPNPCPEPFGIDGFYCDFSTLQPFRGTRFAMGQPAWDYFLPRAYLAAGRKLFGAKKLLGRHEMHQRGWSDRVWTKMMQHAIDPTDRHLRNPRHLIGEARRMSAEIHTAMQPLEL